MEGRVGAHLVEPRHRALVAQQRFRRHQDQRLADFAPQLPAQDVEVIRRRRAVRDLHVVFGAHLQEALEPRRGMLRPLPFIAMRQQADEAGHAQPFALARRDELVEHHLRAVGEIAELRFPQRQRIRLRGRIAVFEAEHGLFREHRVEHFVARLVVAQMIERRVARLGPLIEQHRMALREGAALGILARQPHRMAVEQQRAEGQRLGRSPSRCPRRSRSPCGGCRESASMVRWTWKSSGTAVIFSPISFSFVDIDAGVAAARIVDLACRP